MELTGNNAVGLLSAGGTLIAFLLYKKWQNQSTKLPPGPAPSFLFGNMRQLDHVHPQLTMHEWVRKYGDIITLYIYSKPVILVSSLDAIREVLITKSNEFAGRPYMYRGLYLLDMHDDITTCSINPKWILRKKAFMNSLKMYGERLSLLERITQDLLQELCEDIDKIGPQTAFDPKTLVHDTAANIIASLIFGRKMEPKDLQTLSSFDREIFNILSPIGNGPEIDVYPWLRFFGNSTFKKMVAIRTQLREWFFHQMDIWKDTYDPNNPRCVMDALTLTKDNEKDEEGNPMLTDIDVMLIVLDMILGGVTTTATSTYCFLAIVSTHPDIQRKIQEEIERNIGSRIPSLSDRSKMHYTEASVIELLRKHRGTSVPHATVVDTTLGGYNIPRGTEVWTNLWSLHNDEDFWDDPWTFKPERFLDSDGKLVPIDHPKRRHMFNFGAGRRVCPGETIGKNRLFLIVASLLQRFTFLPEDGLTAGHTDPREFKISLSLGPKSYKVKAVPRI